MPVISSAGIGSNLPVDSIVSGLLAVERKPIDLLKTQNTQLQTSLSTFGKLQGSLATLRDAAAKLGRTDLWAATSASSSDSNAVSVTTTATAAPGSYSIAVQSLAASQLGASVAYASSTAVVGQGVLHIDLGTWDKDLGTFEAKDGSSTLDISIGAGEDTLEKVRDKINAAGAGITASIVNDASGARLAIKSSATGLDNGFRISVDDADGGGGDTSGLSALAYDPENGISSLAKKQSAANAMATINGLEVNSSTNTLTNVIDGLNVTLGKVTTSDVNITVAQDTTSISKAITDYATAYSDVAKFLKEQTKYDSVSKASGALQGDRAATNLITQLRAALTGTSTAAVKYQRLADIGLDPAADGTIKVDSSKLTTALGNLADVKAMFADGSSDANRQGLAVRMRKLTDEAMGVDGALTARQDGLRRSLTVNSKQQAQLEDRVANTEKRLRAQYTALDAKMAGLNGLSSFMSQQVAQYNKG
ncbi:MAG: flagellar filament capping protein FliD [Burkholderiaceae bacterium]|nr:flagellar filament capping protein FliD [Burkholderiaceae bacterium]